MGLDPFAISVFLDLGERIIAKSRIEREMIPKSRLGSSDAEKSTVHCRQQGESRIEGRGFLRVQRKYEANSGKSVSEGGEEGTVSEAICLGRQ